MSQTMTVPDTETQRLSGRARALLAAAREARTEEGLAGLLAAAELAALRDERTANVLGANSFAALIAREIPSLDRRSLRSLLSVADAFVGHRDVERLAGFGLTRLALAAQAPDIVRDELLAGPVLPLREMRRALRETNGAVVAERLRSGGAQAPHPGSELVPRGDEPIGPLSDREARGRAVLAAASRHWREAGAASFALSRRLADIAKAEIGQETEQGVVAFALSQAGFDAEEISRATALVETFALLPLARREAIGIGALRAVAAVEGRDVRNALVGRLRQEELVGDAAIAAARAGRPLGPRLEAPAPAAAAHWVDDPERLSPFNLLYLADFDDAGFEEATPPDLVEQILLRASGPGDLVCDLTAGSGTVAQIAATMARDTVSVDLLDPPLAEGIGVGDARTVTPAGAPFKTVILHPPVPMDVLYSERYAGRPLPGDLSSLEPETYQRAMRDILDHGATLLRRDGRLALICRESRFGERLIDWPARFERMAQSAGLTLDERLHAVLGPKARAQLVARHGLAARRDRRAIPVVLSVLFFTPARKERSR